MKRTIHVIRLTHSRRPSSQKGYPDASRQQIATHTRRKEDVGNGESFSEKRPEDRR